MSVAVPEADDLVLDRGAIARSGAADLPGIHRRAMHIGPDHGMGCGGGPGDAPLGLRRRGLFRHHRKRLKWTAPRLHLYRPPLAPRRPPPPRGPDVAVELGKARTDRAGAPALRRRGRAAPRPRGRAGGPR